MNSDHEQLELIRRYIDGTATPEEMNALQETLRNDAAFRHLYARYANLDSALGDGRLASGAMVKVEPRPRLPSSFRWLSWRPLTAAAAGIALGMLVTSVVFAHGAFGTQPKERRLFPLRNGNFEQVLGALPANPPASFNMWSGNGAEVVAGSGEANPKSGRRMLRFTRAEVDPPTSQGVPVRCDVYQLIDLRQVWEQVADDDEVTLEVRASFLDTDSRPEGSGTFRCRLLINPKSPDVVLAGWPESRSDGCAYVRAELENGPATRGQWRTAQAKVILPRNARVAAVHLGVIRFTDAQQPGAEFGHCYVDDVTLTVTARHLRQKE